MENKSKNLIALAMFGLFFAFASQALAYVPGVFGPERANPNSGPAFTEVPTVYNNGYYDSVNAARYANERSFTNAVNTDKNMGGTAPYNAVSNTYYSNTTSKVKSDTGNSNIPNSGYQNVNGYNSTSAPYPYNGQIESNGLTALSLNGSGSFMPSSVWQWILVIFLILIIVIIARTLSKKPAMHEQHTVPTH